MAEDKRYALTGSMGGAHTECHGIYVMSFIVFAAIACIANVLARDWRAWLPGSEGHRSMLDGIKAAVNSFMPYIV